MRPPEQRLPAPLAFPFFQSRRADFTPLFGFGRAWRYVGFPKHPTTVAPVGNASPTAWRAIEAFRLLWKGRAARPPGATVQPTGPGVQSPPASGRTFTSGMTPRCRPGSKWRIVRSLRSMMRPGLSGPTSFILTMTFLPTAATRAYFGFAPNWTPPNFLRKLVLMAADQTEGS